MSIYAQGCPNHLYWLIKVQHKAPKTTGLSNHQGINYKPILEIQTLHEKKTDSGLCNENPKHDLGSGPAPLLVLLAVNAGSCAAEA